MSDSERVLAALRTGPKTAAQLYQLHCIVHSRISDLRRAGHVIECSRTGGVGAESYLYTLGSEATRAQRGAVEPLSPVPAFSTDASPLSLVLA